MQYYHFCTPVKKNYQLLKGQIYFPPRTITAKLKIT